MILKTAEGSVTIPADTVILSVGYTPDRQFALDDEKPGKSRKSRKIGSAKLYFVGDCDRVGSLKTVINQAYELVQEISY